MIWGHLKRTILGFYTIPTYPNDFFSFRVTSELFALATWPCEAIDTRDGSAHYEVGPGGLGRKKRRNFILMLFK